MDHEEVFKINHLPQEAKSKEDLEKWFHFKANLDGQDRGNQDEYVIMVLLQIIPFQVPAKNIQAKG